jgi:hypothetical protein
MSIRDGRRALGLHRPTWGSAFWMALLALSACATLAAEQPPSAAPPTPAETLAPAPAAAAPESPIPTPEPPAAAVKPPIRPASRAELPPCIPAHRPRPKHHRPKPAPAPETAATGPPPPPPADTVVDARVGEIGTSLGSILGRDVKSPKGEDLGRVVDVLADAQGHVRVAIIDFGGFLGVGTRRIAVDWPLLRFDASARDKPLILSVDRQKLQSAPEYNSNKPRVLMPPAAPDAPDAGQATK